MRTVTISLFCCLLAAAVLAADPAPAAPKTRAEIDQQIAALSQRQIELAFGLRDQLQKIEQLWADPQYTSPEIEQLRKRLRQLEAERQEIQAALRARVAELPGAQAEIAKVEQGKAEHQAMARQIEDLKKRRDQAR
jgi:chromosome segregation ATPase